MSTKLKQRALILRKQGKTYTEIVEILKTPIPKSTLSCWCHSIPMSLGYKNKIKLNTILNIEKARGVALGVNKTKRQDYLQAITEQNQDIALLLKDRGVAKIALVMLYLCEGSRTRKGSLMFGNSDPLIIGIFLKLLRKSYPINESKFRCTLQCRVGQNTKELENYWTHITQIPSKQFYGARIDQRTIGKPLRKPDYKGVCRIDYFSADIYNEIKIIAQIIDQKY
jgi:hypothetical protein